jgi:hypothetical protein
LYKPELLVKVTRILQVAQKQKAGMLVLGSKGAIGLPHLLLGSVAEQVVGLWPSAGHHRQGTAEELISTHRRRQQHESRTVAPPASNCVPGQAFLETF